MSQKNSEQDGNLNFHSEGKSVFGIKSADPIFQDYRRQWRENPVNGYVANFPLHIDIEATNACNLRCPHCASTSDGWGTPGKGFISMELFKKILKEASEENAFCLKFSLRGEPLLHPRIIEIIKLTSESGIPDFYFNTNGMMLNSAMSEALIDSGLPRISISIDGWDRDSFNSLRPGADYDLVCKNLKELISLRAQKKSPTPQVRVQAVMLPDFKPHWEDYKATWQEVADEVGYLDAREEGHGFDHKGIITDFKCPFLWQRMTVLWDGTVLPCLAHGVKNIEPLVLGNASRDSIKLLWKSEISTKLRELHTIGQSHLHPSCNECSFRALEARKLLEKKENI